MRCTRCGNELDASGRCGNCGFLAKKSSGFFRAADDLEDELKAGTAQEEDHKDAGQSSGNKVFFHQASKDIGGFSKPPYVKEVGKTDDGYGKSFGMDDWKADRSTGYPEQSANPPRVVRATGQPEMSAAPLTSGRRPESSDPGTVPQSRSSISGSQGMNPKPQSGGGMPGYSGASAYQPSGESPYARFPESPHKKKPWGIIIGAVGAVAVLAGIVIFLLAGNPSGTPVQEADRINSSPKANSQVSATEATPTKAPEPTSTPEPTETPKPTPTPTPAAVPNAVDYAEMYAPLLAELDRRICYQAMAYAGEDFESASDNRWNIYYTLDDMDKNGVDELIVSGYPLSDRDDGFDMSTGLYTVIDGEIEPVIALRYNNGHSNRVRIYKGSCYIDKGDSIGEYDRVFYRYQNGALDYEATLTDDEGYGWWIGEEQVSEEVWQEKFNVLTNNDTPYVLKMYERKPGWKEMDRFGSCGSNATWSYDGNGVLTISGSGSMDDYQGFGDLLEIPWWRKDLIKTVRIEPGITRIGDNAFGECLHLSRIEISESVSQIGENAFNRLENPVIYGMSGSYAQNYAQQNDFAFIAIDAPTSTVETPNTDANAYDTLIALYGNAVREKWDSSRLSEFGLNYQLNYGDDWGYLLRDINGDGTQELLVGRGESGTFVDVYTLSGEGIPIKIKDTTERSSLYLCADGVLLLRASSGAETISYLYYRLPAGSTELEMVEELS